MRKTTPDSPFRLKNRWFIDTFPHFFRTRSAQCLSIRLGGNLSIFKSKTFPVWRAPGGCLILKFDTLNVSAIPQRLCCSENKKVIHFHNTRLVFGLLTRVLQKRISSGDKRLKCAKEINIVSTNFRIDSGHSLGLVWSRFEFF